MIPITYLKIKKHIILIFSLCLYLLIFLLLNGLTAPLSARFYLYKTLIRFAYYRRNIHEEIKLTHILHSLT